MSRATRVLLTPLLITMLTLSACAQLLGIGMQPTITLDEANQRLDSYIDQAASQLPEEANFTDPHHYYDRRCEDPTDQGPQGRKHASRDYYVEGLDSSNIPSYFDTLESWWLDNNFRVLDHNPPNEFLWVENNDDSFRMTLKANQRGEMRIIAASPCVWPEGTPDPE